MELVALTETEVTEAFYQLKQRLRSGAAEYDLTVIPSTSAGKSRAYWHDAEGIWAVLEQDDDEGKYWCIYGVLNPAANKTQRSVCQGNVAQKGAIWRTAGAFARDSKGQLYYVHNGQVRGPGSFGEQYQGARAQIQWPNGRTTERFVVGRLNERRFVASLAAYVHAIEGFKKGDTDKSYQEAITAGLDAGIKEAQAEIKAVERGSPSNELTPLPVADPEVQDALTFAQTRMDRLAQVKQWVRDDPDLLHGMVGTIRKRDQALQRRRTVISVVVAFLSLMAGWLLSGVNPAIVLGQFVGH
jgi:hypothetical protein